MFPIRFYSASEVRGALPMPAAIEAMRRAFGALALGHADTPARTAVSVPGDATLLVMPGRVRAPAALGAKLVSVFPHNAETSVPSVPVVQALVVLFDPETGTPSAILDGTALTAIRTGAASGLATDLLARADAHSVAILGAGAQARTQLEAVRCVRKIDEVVVWSRTKAKAAAFAAETGARIADSAAEAAHGADIICCATSSAEPVLFDADVSDGTHVNAVGSFTPAMREFDPELLGRAIVVVDQREAALAEAGEIIAALRGGVIVLDQVVELGALVNGTAGGRTSARDITLFKSVGLAVQDLVAASDIVRRDVQGQ